MLTDHGCHAIPLDSPSQIHVTWVSQAIDERQHRKPGTFELHLFVRPSNSTGVLEEHGGGGYSIARAVR